MKLNGWNGLPFLQSTNFISFCCWLVLVMGPKGIPLHFISFNFIFALINGINFLYFLSLMKTKRKAKKKRNGISCERNGMSLSSAAEEPPAHNQQIKEREEDWLNSIECWPTMPHSMNQSNSIHQSLKKEINLFFSSLLLFNQYNNPSIITIGVNDWLDLLISFLFVNKWVMSGTPPSNAEEFHSIWFHQTPFHLPCFSIINEEKRSNWIHWLKR